MKTRTSRILPALVAITLVAAACGSDEADESTSTDAPAATEAPAATDEPITTDAPVTTDAPGTIVEVAVGAGDFTTLVAAVDAADLVETLSGEGPFTVLAPTDEAFATALTNLGLTAEELLADKELLTSVLTYHVIPGVVLAETVVTLDGQSVATVNGAEVAISVDGDTVMVNDATVIAVDVLASNGVIHVIDTVLVPAS
jgi:transforming growth factor-beta-induced protein